MPDNTPKKKSTAKPESKPLRIADYNEYLSRKGAFDDSTNTYNDSIRNHSKLLKAGMSKTGSTKPSALDKKLLMQEGEKEAKVIHEYGETYNKPVKKTVLMQQKTSANIAPVKINSYVGKTLTDENGVGYQQETKLPIYKAPVQRVEYDDSLQRKPVVQDKQIDPAPTEKIKTDASLRMPGYKRVASSDPKYKRFREYATYTKKEGAAKEDPFKKATLEARKMMLEKKSAPKK